MELTTLPISSITPYYIKRQLPPDVNSAESNFLTSPRWYSRLAIPWPLLYLVHGTIGLILLVLAIFFAIYFHGVIKPHPEPFWDLFPEFLAIFFSTTLTLSIQFIVLPKFWRERAKELIAAGHFETAYYTRSGGRGLVLELGCNEGSTSAIFARAIVNRQRDISNLSGPTASFPIFIGYDKWSKWSRIPNKPINYLETLTDVGVPRDCIIANRVSDPTSSESRTTLPYADNSISLIISNLGISEVCKWNKSAERVDLFRELTRVLEPGGRMIVVENESPKKPVYGNRSKWARRFSGPMMFYKELLVHEKSWPVENIETKRWWGIHYMIAVKPGDIKLTV